VSRPASPKPCLFCAIARGQGEAHVVHEDARTIAFLDKAPLVYGHVLLIPRAHIPTIYEADEETVTALALASQKLAKGVTEAMGADGVFLAQNTVVSQSVPHLHTHVIPRRRNDGFFSPRIIWRRIRYAPGKAEETAAKIRAALGVG